ncbi:MAG: EF-hand domain-containing protein [Candidatus Binatia bacterium]
MKTAATIVTAFALGALSWGMASTALAGEEVCVGDCNGDGQVKINELILGVGISLGTADLEQCPAFDPSGDGVVSINELIKAVSNSLNGCAVTPPGTTRIYTIAPGTLSGQASTTATGLFTTGLGNANAANSFSPGPLTLELGEPDGDGIATLGLAEDLILEVDVLDGSCLCLNMDADATTGSIDCDGGTAYDTRAFQPLGDVGEEFMVMLDLGDPSGPGDGNLIVPLHFENIATPCEVLDCTTVTYDGPLLTFAFTTTTATAVKGNITLAIAGEPFSCENFGTVGSGGQLAAPAPAFQQGLNVANVFRFGELVPTP